MTELHPARPLHLGGGLKAAAHGARSPAGAKGQWRQGWVWPRGPSSWLGQVRCLPGSSSIPPPPGEDAPSSHSSSPPSSATPEGRCTLRAGNLRVGRAAFWVQARLCGSARKDPAWRVAPEAGP